MRGVRQDSSLILFFPTHKADSAGVQAIRNTRMRHVVIEAG